MERLNRDTTKINKSLVSISTGTSVSATLDTRLLTSDGQKQIAEDFLKTGMLIDTVKEIATNSTVGIGDFDTEVKKRNTTYEAIKQRLSTDSTLTAQLSSTAYTDEQKNVILNSITQEVMSQLGYQPTQTNLIATTEPGRDGEQVKGFYSTQTNSAYVNDLYNNTNYDLLQTSATESQRAMDAQNGSKFDQSQEYRDDRSAYSQNFGTNVANYTDFALGQTNQGSLSTEYNKPQDYDPSSLNLSPTVSQNNDVFKGLDKTKGDNWIQYLVVPAVGGYLSWRMFDKMAKDHINAVPKQENYKTDDEYLRARAEYLKKDLPIFQEDAKNAWQKTLGNKGAGLGGRPSGR